MKNFLTKHKDWLLLLLLWLFIICVINPFGDFPLNDDWCYGKSVKTLHEEGFLKLYNWGEMTLIAHVYWGYLFTKVFGFSFTVLRIATLVLAYFSIVGVYELCRLVNLSRWLCLLSTMLCMMNPVFLSLSFSFMTDVPFYAVSIWAFYFFFKALRTDNWIYLIVAVVFCVWGLLIRQLMLIFPIVWLVTYFFINGINKKKILKGILPLLIILITYFSFTFLMASKGLLQERYNSRIDLLLETIKFLNLNTFFNIFGYFILTITYLGFLLLPIHLFSFKYVYIKKYIVWLIIYTVTISTILIITNKLIPCLDNVWIDFGVGPTTLYDFYGNVKETPSPIAPKLLWYIVTVLGVASSSIFLLKIKTIVQEIIAKKGNYFETFFSLCFSIIYLSPFLIIGLYDRYLLPLFPMALVLLLANTTLVQTKSVKYFSIFFLVLISWFSIAATHDYLSWNRVRWLIINELQESGVSNNKIQGGIEHTTWYFFSENKQKWWEDCIPVYALVFKPKNKDLIIKEYKYSRWLPGKGNLYLIYDEKLDKNKTNFIK